MMKKLIISMVMLLVQYTGGAAQSEFAHLELMQRAGKVLVGDIDQDGKNDVIFRGDTLSWLHYPGFQEYVIKTGTFSGDRFALADMDKDGDLDIISGKRPGGDSDKHFIYWYENPRPKRNPKKSSDWREHLIGDLEKYIKDLDAADINRDGAMDAIARAHDYSKVFFQKKDTWLEKKIEHPRKEGMALADLDLDGDTDIILNGFWLETPADAENGTYTQRNIDAKWYNQDTGSWQDNCSYVGVADINQDGIPDVVIAHSEKTRYPLSWYTVASRQQLKSGPWIEHHISARFDWCETVDIGDVDKDGTLDILAAKFQRRDPENYDNPPPYPVQVFYNINGDGLTWKSQTLAETGMYAGILADVGSDGDLDVLGPRSYWTGPIEMWQNENMDTPMALDRWTHIQLDDSRHKRFFGLAMGDLTRDGYKDIVAGQWFYRNPGGEMSAKWQRIALPIEVDAVLIVDVDDDAFGDVIALSCNKQYWFEADDLSGNSWHFVQIGALAICDHQLSTQQYNIAQIVPGGKPEVLLANRYYLEIPENPSAGNWPFTKISDAGGGYSAADIDGDGFLDIAGYFGIPGEDEIVPGTRSTKWWSSQIAWWQNPVDGSGHWQRFEVGTGTHTDRVLLADLNGDGRADIVTSEERYPGHSANAFLYWFEQPADPTKTAWKRHQVAKQFSMNNLDVADMDRDGDIDIITCEHSMPYRGTPAPGKERLQIWENDGKGHFKERVIDRNKESHLGSRVADLDGDGDLDIVSIAWRDYQYLHLWRNDAIQRQNLRLRESAKPLDLPPYYLDIDVHANHQERFNRAVTVDLNMTDLLKLRGQEKAFAKNSLLLLETDEKGRVLSPHVPFQFDPVARYDAEKRARISLSFLLNGRTAADAKRSFRLYFGPTGNSYADTRFTPQVTVEDVDAYEGSASFKITTPAAVYVYHKRGSGFASMIDVDGNDWISFHPTGGGKGNYRGIPNVAPAGFHPGAGMRDGQPINKISQITSQGPIKVTLQSESIDEKWGCTWDIYPYYATMTLFKKGEEPYWILYEGTPGGEFNETDFWVHSDGTRLSAKPYYRDENNWLDKLPSPKWVYFGDANLDRVLYLLHHQDYDAQDVFWHFGEGGMTVFGFGRGPHIEGQWQQLTGLPAHFSIGFAEDGSFDAARKMIEAIYKPLRIRVGTPEVLQAGP